MNSIKFLIASRMLKEKFKLLPTITLLLVLLLSACSAGEVAATSPAVQDTPAEIPPTLTQIPTTAAIESTQLPTPEEQIYPYYLARAIKPDVAPQTIEGVTAQIDWAYVDESRVAIEYTISGLDWSEGTDWDAMSVRITSLAVADTDIGYGGGGWTHTPVTDGVITGSSDQLFIDGMLDARKHPNIDLRVEIPIDEKTFRFVFNVPVLDGLKIENIDQTVVANGVAMTLKTLLLNPSRAEALICFQMPSAVDWGLTASTVTVGDREYSFSGGGLVPGGDGKDFRLTDSERCGSIGFDIIDDESIISITLTVPKLMASVPEVVDEERVKTANRRLAEAGIEFDYINVDHGGRMEILKRPAGMADQEIYPLIWDALAEQYEGPWVFTIPIER